jgi:hypothetical protein
MRSDVLAIQGVKIDAIESERSALLKDLTS